MKRISFAFVLLHLLIPVAVAQQDISGAWTAKLTPEGMGTFDFHLTVEQAPDTLSMWIVLDDGRAALENVVLAEDRLMFVIPMHGEGVDCSLGRRRDNMFAGLCLGPMGESVATMRRIESLDDNE